MVKRNILIPLKIISLGSTPLDSYGQNQVRLQFLPRIVAICIALLFCGSFLSYFNILGLAISNPKIPIPESFTPVNKNISKLSTPATDQNLEIYQQINYTNSDQNCNFLYNKSITQTSLFSSVNQGFWLPQDCNNNILFLQVLKLEPQDIKSLSQQINLESILVSNNIYLLVYKADSASSNLNFEAYLANLSQPIFPSDISFIEATSYDLTATNNYKFYLVGKCQNFEKNECKLWQIENQTGKREIIFTNFLEFLNKDQLPNKTVIKFAKIQDSGPDIVNLIAYKETAKVIILFRVSTVSQLVVQTLVIDRVTEPSNYNKYNR